MQYPASSTVSSILVWLLLSLSCLTYAQVPSLPKWKQRRSALDQVHIVDEFRIYYTLRGDDALPKTHDSNRNSTPDRIENIALQLTTARDLYSDVFKLRHPLESPRYKDKAHFIDVNVGSLPLSPVFDSTKVSGNGMAGDAVVNYFRPSDPPAGIQVLTMDISNNLSITNRTPGHELFHLFQNSYTLFKNPWFTEGTARWVESAFSKNTFPSLSLPLSRKEQRQLFSMKYDAAGFWETFAKACFPNEQLLPPQKLLKLPYIGSKKMIISKTNFQGASLIKELLETLDAMDDQASKDFNLKNFDWPESTQRSPDNNPYLWSAIIDVANKHVTNSQAIRSMMQNLPARGQHTTLSIKGWTIHLNNQLKRDDPKVVETMLGILDEQLDRVVKAIPAKALQQLRSVPIWINPPYQGKPPGAAYHPNIDWLRKNGRDPAMAKAIEITNTSIFSFENKRMPYLMLHELAHAYHDQILDFNQPEIRAAFERARDSKSYYQVQHFNGKKIVTGKAYAMSNHKEYFAEATEAYFGRNDFFPFNKKELKAHDPKIHDLVEKVWGIDKNPPQAKPSQVKPVIPSSHLAFTTAADTQCPPSTNGGGKTTVIFRNNRTSPVTVFWIDTKGDKAQQFTISPGNRERRLTFAGHSWLVTNDSGKEIGHFVSTATAAWADVPAIRIPSNHGAEKNAALYPITTPPAQLKLPAFYKKCLNLDGFLILSSEKVNHYALREAAYLIQMMLANRPDVLEALVASGARLTVMAHNEYTTDVPEHARMGKQKNGGSSAWWDRRARGLGGSEIAPVASCAEENLLCFPGDPYSKENILIHEFAHMMHLRGLKRIDSTFDTRLQKIWQHAMDTGLWKDKYPSTNSREYFAEGVQSWFNNNRQNDYEHNHVNTRKELIEYDPQLATLLKEVFGDTKLVYIKPPERRAQAHLEGYDYSQSPHFEWPERLKNLGHAIKTRRNKK